MKSDAEIKPENNFQFTKEGDKVHETKKNERIKESEINRAKKQIMLFNVPNPIGGPSKKYEMERLVEITNEMRPGWIGEEHGFHVTKEEVERAQYERLWRYGDENFKGPMPVKVTFNRGETATKFINGARKAGLLGRRIKIRKGKFQNVDEKELPPTFIRGGSTYEQRQASRKKKEVKLAHKGTIEFGRYKGALARDEKHTHKSSEVVAVDDDLFDDKEEYLEEQEPEVEAPKSGAAGQLEETQPSLQETEPHQSNPRNRQTRTNPK